MLKFLTLFLIGLAIAFVGPLIGVAGGAFVGWIVGGVFVDTVAKVSDWFFPGQGVPGWQLGAALGFVGSFFKQNISINKG